MRRVGLVFVVLIASWPSLAHATGTGQGKGAMGVWKATDNCAKIAQQQFPDFTAESNAKREAALQRCLAGRNLPPREEILPQSTPAK